MVPLDWKEKILVFDLETQRSFEEVGGRNSTRKLGLSLGVVYDYRDGEYRTYREEDVEALIADLASADRIVGFNLLSFDYEVLRGYRRLDFKSVDTLDMLAHIHAKLGHRVSLSSLAKASLGEDKSGNGLEAIHWYREGNWKAK